MRAALAGLFLVLAGCGDRAAGARPVRIAAASSLAHFLEQVKPGWEGAHPGEILEVSPGASSTLARQLFEGAEADVFLSADRDSLDRAGERVRRETRRILYANRLAAVGVDAPSLATLATLRVAICGPEVPSGKAWRAYLASRGVAGADRWVQAENVRAALALFESEAVDVALVFSTEATACRRPHAAWVPPDAPPAPVWGAAVSDSPAARAFLDYLESPPVREAARRTGLSDPPP